MTEVDTPKGRVQGFFIPWSIGGTLVAALLGIGISIVVAIGEIRQDLAVVQERYAGQVEALTWRMTRVEGDVSALARDAAELRRLLR